jgi:hypothetical protein
MMAHDRAARVTVAIRELIVMARGGEPWQRIEELLRESSPTSGGRASPIGATIT